METLRLEYNMKRKDLNIDGTDMLHMEQKDYNMEVLSVLIGGKSHIREIAKKLNTNNMMVLRRLKELLGKNVVDFRREGRNQVYFIKDSPEARAFVIMAEQYKLIKCLGKYPYLKDIVKNIQNNRKIRLAVVFGSHAKSLAGKNSDVDIFIETSDRKLKEKYSGMDSKLSIKTGKLGSDNLSKEIEKNHVLIKGGEIYHERFFD